MTPITPINGSILHAEPQASSSATDRCTPRWICFGVNSANQRSTWFNQLADVGVNCTCQGGRLASQPFGKLRRPSRYEKISNGQLTRPVPRCFLIIAHRLCCIFAPLWPLTCRFGAASRRHASPCEALCTKKVRKPKVIPLKASRRLSGKHSISL